jgi:hypothetical protein
MKNVANNCGINEKAMSDILFTIKKGGVIKISNFKIFAK